MYRSGNRGSRRGLRLGDDLRRERQVVRGEQHEALEAQVQAPNLRGPPAMFAWAAHLGCVRLD